LATATAQLRHLPAYRSRIIFGACSESAMTNDRAHAPLPAPKFKGNTTAIVALDGASR